MDRPCIDIEVHSVPKDIRGRKNARLSGERATAFDRHLLTLIR